METQVLQAKIVGARIDLAAPFGGSSIPLNDEVRSLWSGWRDTYTHNLDAKGKAQLLSLGREMLAWLNQTGWAKKWLETAGALNLEIASGTRPNADDVLFFDLPWEILANDLGFLAEDVIQPYSVWRRVGQQGGSPELENKDLSMLFMASSPCDMQPELNYEEEEAAILQATHSLELTLYVEETGCPEEVRTRLLQGEEFDVMHFSCHGHVLTAEEAQRLSNRGGKEGPALVMEDQEGEVTYVHPSRLAEIWEGKEPPKLVFLSACRTAEVQDGLEAAYTAQLIRAVPCVLGWDGSVMDPDATAFAEYFYKELAGFAAVTSAAAKARRLILNSTKPNSPLGAHWHLARLWLGPSGGNPICNSSGRSRELPQNAGYKAFLDKRNNRGGKVASELTFVGRRREAQEVTKCFRRDDQLGVVLLGMGNLGKSSLAARVLNRFPNLSEVVIYDDYDAIGVFNKLIEAVPAEKRKASSDEWFGLVRDNPLLLKDALEAFLKTHFLNDPVLLIIDDFEQVLQPPKPGETTCLIDSKNGWADTMVAVLSAFRKAKGKSRILFTSRYEFNLVDTTGRELGSELFKLNLPPFNAVERKKQWRAELNVRKRSPKKEMRDSVQAALQSDDFETLRNEIDLLSEGNPGVQDLFSGPLMNSEFDTVRLALADVRNYLRDTNERPEDNSIAFDFVRRMTLDAYQSALTSSESSLLRASSLFGEGVWPKGMIAELALASIDRYRSRSAAITVPGEVLDTLGTHSGLLETGKMRHRLVGLGLLDVYGTSLMGKSSTEYAVNRFARPVISTLTETERKQLSPTAIQAVELYWKPDGKWPHDDARSVEALRLALHAVGNT